MKDKILIIGASGSIVLEVAGKLIEKKQPVKIAVRDPERAKKINLGDTELVKFDYLNNATFDTAFEGIKKVVLVSPPSYLKIHKQVIEAIDSAIKKGVELIVNISAISIESDLDKPMKQIEDHIKNSGVDYVFLRPNCYMQNFNDLFRDFIISEEEITLPTGDTKISFVDVRDVAEVAALALTDNNLKNKTFQLTGKQLLNMHVIAYLFSEALHKEIYFHDISKEVFEKILRSAGWPAGTIEGTLQLCSHVKDGITSRVTPDLETILKREPIKFQQFISDYIKTWN
jgi:uncharacterized protein YbjT (DUF2867 family)